MGSIDNKLTDGERIIYRTGCHWAMLLGPMIVIIIGGLSLRAQGIHAIALMAFGFVWGGFSYASLRASDVALTSTRVLINAGFPLRRTYDIPLNEIVAVDYHQPALGSMLNFGKLIIVDKKHGRATIRFVSSPMDFTTKVRQQILSSGRP
ncbi:MAG TPA: PH domain-containing protein [Syntrophorhabdales bacterium]|nr:PH domain-containing protein [Syntrophorhabdales bacterium]